MRSVSFGLAAISAPSLGLSPDGSCSMGPITTLSYELSQSLSKMAPCQFFSPTRQLNTQLSPAASVILLMHCSPPLFRFSLESSGAASSHCVSASLTFLTVRALYHGRGTMASSFAEISLFIVSMGFNSFFKSFLGPGDPLPSLSSSCCYITTLNH